jgi:hypothetical protein
MEAKPQAFVLSASSLPFLFLASSLPGNRLLSDQANYGKPWRKFDNSGKHGLCNGIAKFAGGLRSQA